MIFNKKKVSIGHYPSLCKLTKNSFSNLRFQDWLQDDQRHSYTFFLFYYIIAKIYFIHWTSKKTTLGQGPDNHALIHIPISKARRYRGSGRISDPSRTIFNNVCADEHRSPKTVYAFLLNFQTIKNVYLAIFRGVFLNNGHFLVHIENISIYLH